MEELFKKLEQAKSVKDLDALINANSEIKKNVEGFEQKYPKLDFKITTEDVEKAINDKKITEDHLINLKDGDFSELEKLLIAVLWKNGHITRVQSVLDGIIGKKTSSSKYGVVFNQFGKSLASENEPIIDQHVLRAFSIYGDLSSVKGRTDIPNNAALTDDYQDLIDAYRDWAKNIVASANKDEASEFAYKLDKVLFMMGKIFKDR